MRFSLNFVKEFLDIKIDGPKLVNILTMAGMEVEYYQQEGNDWIFDIEVTSNRYDWLSIAGISREVAACLGKNLKIKYPKIIKTPAIKTPAIKIENPGDTIFYVGRIIKNIKVGQSPDWLKQRLTNCGLTVINNVVDITNCNMLKWGNPLHAFDWDKIEGGIYCRRAKPQEKFIGIDDKERVLTSENLVISDDKKIIALAGVMGAKNTEVDNNTKNIFLEAAIFSSLTVRRSRRAVGLDTDSSYRFERRVSADCLEYASQESCSLMETLAGGEFSGYIQAGKKPVSKTKKIQISLNDLTEYLGQAFDRKEVLATLNNLGCKTTVGSIDKITVVPPLFRFDLQREVDVYEEIVRIHGYNDIESCLPFLNHKIVGDQGFEFKHKLRCYISLLGMKEIITFSIEAEEDLAGLNEEGLIKLVNPLRKQENTMRPSLFLGMIKALKHNLNRGSGQLKFFEIANTYCLDQNGYSESPVLSLAVTGKDNFTYLKAVIENVSRNLNLETLKFQEKPRKNFSNSLEIIINKQTIGFLGKLDLKLAKKMDLRADIFFSQIDINALQQFSREKLYREFSLYPAVSRDISLAIRKDKKFDAIKNIIKNEQGYIVDLQVIDTYKGKDLPSDFTALTLRVFYQSPQKTFTSEEVDGLHNRIREELQKQDGIVLR